MPFLKTGMVKFLISHSDAVPDLSAIQVIS